MMELTNAETERKVIDLYLKLHGELDETFAKELEKEILDILSNSAQ